MKIFSKSIFILIISLLCFACKSNSKIDENAIQSDDKMITLSANLETIGIKAFINCTSLKQISIPSLVKYIEEETLAVDVSSRDIISLYVCMLARGKPPSTVGIPSLAS